MANQKFQLKVVSGAPGQLTGVFDQNVVTIGRGAGSDLRIENGVVSRQHAEVLRSTKGFMLYAQSKTNPVKVDGETVPPEQASPLSPGSQIVLSNQVVISFTLVSDDVRATPRKTPKETLPSEPETDAFSPALLAKVRSSLAQRSDPPAKEGPNPGRSSSVDSPSRATIPLSRSGTEGLLDPPLEAPKPEQSERVTPKAQAEGSDSGNGGATELSEGPPSPNQSEDPPPSAGPTPREQSSLLTKLFSKAPEVVEVVSGPRPRSGNPGAAIKVEGLRGEDRVEVYDDLLIGAGPDSDVVIQGAYAPRRAALAVRVGDRYRLYNVSPSVQTVRVNGRAVEGQAALQDGDEVEVYGVRLQVAIPAR